MVKKKKIMVVDDNPTNLKIAQSALEKDYDVVLISSGEKALDVLVKTNPDLILLDIQMPGISGYEVIKRIKDMGDPYEDIPVIFLTVKDDNSSEYVGLDLGAVDYVSKPYYIPLLLKRLEVHLKLASQHNKFKKRATLDPLTNCYNKISAEEEITEILEESGEGMEHSLFFLDLDNFKYVNDNLGHAFGDYLLSQVGKRLLEKVRNNDIVGRTGGDEFLVFLRGTAKLDFLLGKAEEILDSISQEVVKEEQKHSIFGSLGIAIYPDHGTTYDQLYHHADKALYRSKERGKNMVTLYTRDLEQPPE